MNNTNYRAFCKINQDAILHNFLQVRKLAPGSKVIAVVKADGYGHGLRTVTSTLCEYADAFAVATVEEALTCREIVAARKEVVVLSQWWHEAHLETMIAASITPVVANSEQLALVLNRSSSSHISLWLKVDTGMHRLGFDAKGISAAFAQLQSIETIKVGAVMTHFANADQPDLAHSVSAESQFEHFMAIDFPNQLPLSAANSAAIVSLPDAHLNWVRPGIMLTGSSPFADDADRQRLANYTELQPVMSFYAHVISIKTVKAGQYIGYGSRYQAPQEMRVAAISVGYGDGYPRHIDDRAYVMINEHKAPIVGRVSMDTITVDVSDLDVAVGDSVCLWGDALPVEAVAAWADTISYELFCRIPPRVLRIPYSSREQAQVIDHEE